MRTCEICDRPIRTGRKYCWEHRRTAPAEALRGDRITNEATNEYIHFQKRQENKKIDIQTALLVPLSIFLWALIGGIINFFISPRSDLLGLIFILGFFIVPAIVVKFVDNLIQSRNETKIIDKVVDRHPEYVNWVKESVKDEREEKDFRKSLLK